METKKTPKANLESKRPTWLLVGYVVVLAFMFVAFEWTRDIRVDTSGRIAENVFEQDMEIPLTRQPEVTPPPPPQVTPINDVLTIIDDDATAEETNFASSEETGEDVVIKHIPVTVDEEVVVEDEIFVIVEENPQFPDGGTAGLLQYLGNTTYQVEEGQEDNFLIWIKEFYLPEVEKTGALHTPRIVRVLSHREEGSTCYSLQFEVENSGILHRWHMEQGVKLNEELVKIFQDKVVGFPTLMEVIE